MDGYDEEADFDYEDVIDCLKQFLSQTKIKKIFEELNMTSKDILKIADGNLIDAEDDEGLVDYCKRYITFLLVVKITKEYVKEVKEKDEKEEVTGVENLNAEDSKFLNEFASAFDDGDIKKIIGLIIQYSTIPVKISALPKGEIKLTPAQVTRYQAYIKSYQDDLDIELEKYGNILNKKYPNKSKKEDISKEEKKIEEFSNDKEYYKKFILTSKKHNEEYVKKHPEDPKVILLFKKEDATLDEYFEAVRFYNKINSHIIASVGGMKLKAKDYKSKEEMIEAYNNK